VYPQFPDWAPGARTANGIAVTRCNCIVILLVSLVSFAAITLCDASQVFTVVSVYFVIDSIRKLLDTPSYHPSFQLFSSLASHGDKTLNAKHVSLH
jgi:hypothetical protein